MKLFVSWSGTVAQAAAEDFQRWIKSAFRGSKLKVFYSEKTIKPGDRWRTMLKRALSGSDVAVLFLTRESTRSHWVLFEAGAIGKELSSRLYPVLVDIKHGDLPSPLEQFQSVRLADEEGMMGLVKQIHKALKKAHGKPPNIKKVRRSFGGWWPDYRIHIRQLVDETLTGSGDWSLVTEAWVARQIAQSPFQAQDVFRVATRRVDLVDQNHHYVAVDKADEHLELIRRFLSVKNRHVQILAMDSKNRAGVSMAKNLMNARHFAEDLREALKTLRRWKALARRERWEGKFTVRVTGLIPTSFSVFDGEDARGGLVLMPIANRPSTYDWPAIFLSKWANRAAFDSFWNAYTERFQRARALK